MLFTDETWFLRVGHLRRVRVQQEPGARRVGRRGVERQRSRHIRRVYLRGQRRDGRRRASHGGRRARRRVSIRGEQGDVQGGEFISTLNSRNSNGNWTDVVYVYRAAPRFSTATVTV